MRRRHKCAVTILDSYVVKRGDTFVGHFARSLKKPWLWPEIMSIRQIKPAFDSSGDVLSLAYLDRVAVQSGARTESPSTSPLAGNRAVPERHAYRVRYFQPNVRRGGPEDGRRHASRGQVARGLKALLPVSVI